MAIRMWWSRCPCLIAPPHLVQLACHDVTGILHRHLHLSHCHGWRDSKPQIWRDVGTETPSSHSTIDMYPMYFVLLHTLPKNMAAYIVNYRLCTKSATSKICYMYMRGLCSMHPSIHPSMHTYIQKNVTLHYSTVHYLTLPYLTLLYVTLRYVTLTYIHTYMHAYIHTYIRPCMHTYIHTYVDTSIHPSMHACMHTLHYITLHCITLHYSTLHYIHTYTHTDRHTYMHR